MLCMFRLPCAVRQVGGAAFLLPHASVAAFGQINSCQMLNALQHEH